MNEGIQVGRGIAALTILIYHAKLILIRFPEGSFIKLPFFWGQGNVGVPFFFVISGFIICMVVSRPSHNPLNFAIKRWFRLWPTYFFCTVVFVSFYLLHRDLKPSSIDYDMLGLVKSLLFWPQAPIPLLHPGWSLEHEVLFYIFIAIVTFFTRSIWIIFALLALNVTIFMYSHFFVLNIVAWDYHLLDQYNVLFLFGVGSFLIVRRWGYFAPMPFTALGLVAIVTASYVGEMFSGSLYYLKIILQGLASVLLLYGLAGLKLENRLWQFLVFTGRISYSLYLIHFVFIPIFQYLHRELIAFPIWSGELLCILFVVLSWASAVIIYYWIEKPSNDFGTGVSTALSGITKRLLKRFAFSLKQ